MADKKEGGAGGRRQLYHEKTVTLCGSVPASTKEIMKVKARQRNLSLSQLVAKIILEWNDHNPE